MSGRKYRSLVAIQRELAKRSEAGPDIENNMLEPEVKIEEEIDELDV